MKDVQLSCQENIFGTYARLPVVFVRGRGLRLWDQADKEYLDFLAGIAVCNLGHCHPELTRVICQQADTLVHVSNLFYTCPQVELAAELTRLSFADKVFFSNSGAEANEAALKIARKYSKDRYGAGRFHVISMKDSFHGRTLATLSATGQEKVHKGFEPLVGGFTFVDFNSLEAVEKAITDRTCAVLVEPIQGEGGINFPAPGYLRELKELCRKYDLLLIFDEVQVGMGRTGTLFAHEQEGVTPDIMTLAKALANGLPIGAMLATNEVAEAFVPGQPRHHVRRDSPGHCGGFADAAADIGTSVSREGESDRRLFQGPPRVASGAARFDPGSPGAGADGRHGTHGAGRAVGPKMPGKRLRHQLHPRHSPPLRAAADCGERRN